MSFDVYGKDPISEVGKYFRLNNWWWRPLWEYCLIAAPEIAGKVTLAQENEGDGLDADDAMALGKALAASVESGLAKRCAEGYESMLSDVSDEVCWLCNGTGARDDSVVQGRCNACKGTGTVRPMITRYHFSVETVEEFAVFCCASGGFEIW